MSNKGFTNAKQGIMMRNSGVFTAICISFTKCSNGKFKMIDYLVYGLAAAIFLIMGIRAAKVYSGNRTKYNLAVLIAIMIFLVLSLLNLFISVPSLIARLLSSLGVEVPIQIWILLFVIFSVSLIAFFFFPSFL